MGQPRRNEKRYYRGPGCLIPPVSGMGCAGSSCGGERVRLRDRRVQVHTNALLTGRHVVYVPVDGDQDLLHLRRWTIEEVR
jgi:hypothetical protein